MRITTCIDCGTELEYNTRKKQRCAGCKNEHEKDYKRKYYDTPYWKNYEKQYWKKHYISVISFLNCQICGTEVQRGNANQKYCESCKIKAKKIKDKERSQTKEYKEQAKTYRDRPELKERIKNYNNKYLKTEDGKIAIKKKNLKRRGCKYNTIENFTFKEWIEKVNKADGVCPVCNCEKRILTCDHIYPISKANKDYLSTGIKRIYNIEDVQPLCRSCNSSKRDKI